MKNPLLIEEGLRFFLRRIRVGFTGLKRYDGGVEQILEQVIEDAWNKEKEYFMVSSGHFKVFYTRDFGWCCRALIELGYKQRVRKTLAYASEMFKKHGDVTTSINSRGKAFNFPTIASDSVPFLIRSLRILNDEKLIKDHKEFLNRCIERYSVYVFDDDEGMVKKDIWLSSMKDHAVRNSSCYDNCMCMMLKDDLEKLKGYGIVNPFSEHDIEKNISKFLFNGRFFYNDLNKEDEVYGDANIFPFYCRMMKSKIAMKSCMKEMVKNKLDKPFPLKYQSKRETQEKKIWEERFIPGYESDTIWWHMMPIFLRIVKELDERAFNTYLESIKKVIMREKNYLEVFDSRGKPLKGWFYHSDEGMLWASMLLALIRGKEIV